MMKKNILLILLIVLLSCILIYIDLQLKITYYLLLAIFSLLIGKLVFHLFPHFLVFMMIGKTKNYNLFLENPRIIIYIIFSIISISSIIAYKETNYMDLKFSIVLKFIYISSVLCSSFIIILTWTNIFQDLYLPKIQKELINKENVDFKSNYSKEELVDIFNRTSDLNFITLLDEKIEQNDLETFMHIIFNGKVPNQNIFRLNMDHRQTKLYFDCLSKRMIGFTLDDFLNIFENKNGKTTRSKVEPSSSNRGERKQAPKNHIEIQSIFDFSEGRNIKKH